MNKIALILTALAITGFVAAKSIEPGADESENWVERHYRVQEMVYRHECFKEVLDKTLDLLGKGEIDLKTARGRVLTGSQRYYLEYLDYLVWAESGATDEERVARNLVGHLSTVMDIQPHLRARVPVLEQELRELLRATGKQTA